MVVPFSGTAVNWYFLVVLQYGGTFSSVLQYDGTV